MKSVQDVFVPLCLEILEAKSNMEINKMMQTNKLSSKLNKNLYKIFNEIHQYVYSKIRFIYSMLIVGMYILYIKYINLPDWTYFLFLHSIILQNGWGS